MVNMEVHISHTRKEMGNLAGKAVEEKIVSLLEQQEEIRMIFAAAPSQSEFLEYLSQSPIIPWERITAFQMDEYLGLSPDSPPLFSNFLKAHLFDKVKFKNIHLMNGLAEAAGECERYTSLLVKEPIDIVCMGIGENGHIAFNDPPVADFNDPKAVKEVKLDQECRQQQVNDDCFASLDEVPRFAITLTVPTLMSGRYIYCIVPGKNKHKAVAETLFNSISTACPASILRTHSDSRLFLDEESYGKASESFNLSYTEGINCISGKAAGITLRNETLAEAQPIQQDKEKLPFIGPGLIDLQVNGVNGIDFNDVALTETQVAEATRFLLTTGVTTYFPTVITNSDENILHILSTISSACKEDALSDACIGGIHLEGPFLSKKDGARGAHNEKYIKAPDWELFVQFQKASGNRIKLITLAPEWENSTAFIEKCCENDVRVAIGHSSATPKEIAIAIEAGASLSTHLGNAVPLMLPRHPNVIWEQLAQEALYTSLIADGFHLPESFLKVAIKTKKDQALLVSDATCFTGMPPGTYRTHIGEEVVLNDEGKLALSNTSGLLAGATKTLLEDIQHLIDSNIAPLDIAWKMASENPAAFLGKGEANGRSADMVVFDMINNKLSIEKVIKNGETVFDMRSVSEKVNNYEAVKNNAV